jgi:hypothetical protein
MDGEARRQTQYNMIERTPVLVFLVTVVACSGQTLEVGSNGHGGGAQHDDASAGSSQGLGGGANACPGDLPSHSPTGGTGPVYVPDSFPDWPQTGTCPPNLGAAQGTWSGYVQGTSQIPDFTISLEEGGATPCGTVTFGEPMTFPPATDPETNPVPLNVAGLLPGFAYTLLDLELDETRARFRVSYAEPWRSWCVLQTPYCDEHLGGFFCSDAVNWTLMDDGHCKGFDSRDKSLGTVSCVQANLCRAYPGESICDCNASGCVGRQKGYGAAFDFHIEGDHAEGVVDDGVVGQSTSYIERK